MGKEELLIELKNEGFSETILNSFSCVKREDFISSELKELAYENHPLPIGYGQTISQPYTIAFMLSLLDIRDGQKILEVGSGSGYVLALINELADNLKIFGVERIKEIYESSKKTLKGIKNIKVFYGDRTHGLTIDAPFDRILVSAAAEEVPKKLLQQLKIGGVMVVPVKNSIIYVRNVENHTLHRVVVPEHPKKFPLEIFSDIKKDIGENKIKEYPGFVFVPLVKGS